MSGDTQIPALPARRLHPCLPGEQEGGSNQDEQEGEALHHSKRREVNHAQKDCRKLQDSQHPQEDQNLPLRGHLLPLLLLEFLLLLGLFPLMSGRFRSACLFCLLCFLSPACLLCPACFFRSL